MTEVPFHMTRVGQRFYEHTLPRLVEEVARLNERLAALGEAMGRQEGPTDDQVRGTAATHDGPRGVV